MSEIFGMLSKFANTMNNRKHYALIFVGILLISCTDSHISNQRKQHTTLQKKQYAQYLGWGFSLQIPNTLTVNDQTYIDFILYGFVDTSEAEKKGLLFAYAGNYPDFGSIASRNLKKKSLCIHGLNAKVIRWRDDEKLFSCEVLVEMPDEFADDFSMPSYIHFWYKGLSGEEKKIADEIIKSVRPVENDPESSP